MTPEISICIPTYNQAKFLRAAVLSAARQKNVGVKIWISDDASGDETPRVIAQLKEQIPDIIAYRHERNLGMGGNPNWLLRQPQSEYVAKLDSDDCLEPEFCERLLGLLSNYPEAGYAHGNVNEIDENGNITRVRRLNRREEYMDGSSSLLANASGYRVSANIILFRRKALEEVDFWRKDLAFADDWDLAVRLADAGWGNVYADAQLASYRVWSDAKNVRARRKLAEIDGCRRVFAESLEPAYRRRNWPTGPLTRRRQKLAAQHALSLSSTVFDAVEKAALVEGLRALGDGPPLRRRLALLRMGFGGALARKEATMLWAKDAAKRLLRG